MGQHERHLLPRLYLETGARPAVPVLDGDRAVQPGRIGSRDRRPLAVNLPDPRRHRAVVKAQHELHRHRDPPRLALDHADDIGGLPAQGHRVDHPDRAVRRLPLGFQHQRLAAVAPPGARPTASRCEQPVPGPLVVQQRGEAGRGVEPRLAQPIDRPIPTHQRRGLQVTDQPIILDQARHQVLLAWPSGTEASWWRKSWSHPSLACRSRRKLNARRCTLLPARREMSRARGAASHPP